MGLVFRRDKSEKLSISELDGNFEYLAMDSNDIDLFWNRADDYSDYVTDSLYMNDGLGTWYPKTFTTKVLKLGVSVRNWDLIKDFNPEFIIERFKKGGRKNRTYIDIDNKEQPISPAIPTKFRLVDPYSDYITCTEMDVIDPSKISVYRPMIFSMTASSAYYTISAENYFSQVRPPKVMGSGNSFLKESGGTVLVLDDSASYQVEYRETSIGSCFCRIRLRITDGLGGWKYSKPLREFKIKMRFITSGGGIATSMINYELT